MKQIGEQLMAILVKLAGALLTEALLKKALIAGLESLVRKTESELDDSIVAAVKEAWQ